MLILSFYFIYLGKMIIQKKKGIQTDYIAKGKKRKSIMILEIIMKISTYSIVAVQFLSISFNFYLVSTLSIRMIGIIIGFLGVVIFGIAVYTMKDSWRAGIPENDKTRLITNGIYSVSRNPAFLGFYLNYIGILLIFFNLILLAFTIVSILLLHLQILKEEQYLPIVFGDQYIEYKKHVRRYLGCKKI